MRSQWFWTGKQQDESSLVLHKAPEGVFPFLLLVLSPLERFRSFSSTAGDLVQAWSPTETFLGSATLVTCKPVIHELLALMKLKYLSLTWKPSHCSYWWSDSSASSNQGIFGSPSFNSPSVQFLDTIYQDSLLFKHGHFITLSFKKITWKIIVLKCHSELFASCVR